MDATERRQRVSQEATEWLMLLQGAGEHAHREQFVDWLRESPVHVAEMLRIARVHGALGEFDRWARIPTEGAADDADNVVTLHASQQLESPRSSARSLRLVWPVAAMLVVAAVVLAVIWPGWRGETLQTQRAERREVALADGSVVQLDPETTLRVRYDDRARQVFLERGRVLFHVAKVKDRPFLAHARGTTVRAVGTAFAVEQQSDSIVVTVVEGKVEVDNRAAQPDGRMAGSDRGGAAPPVFLTANQQVIVDRPGGTDPVRTVDSGRALAWAEGRLIFDNVSIAAAVRQFNKYNRIQLIVRDPALAGQPISGVFNASDPESFAAFIQAAAAVKVTHSGGSDISLDPID